MPDEDIALPEATPGGPTLTIFSAEVLTAFLAVVPDASAVVDRRGVIVSANRMAERLFRYPEGTLVGMRIEALVPERFRVSHSVYREGFTLRPSVRPMGKGMDLWARRSDGTEFPVDVSLAPIGTPEISLTVASIRDLTERHEAWEAMARLGAIVSSSQDAIIGLGVNGVVISWNPAAERLFGYEAATMVGRPIWRLVANDERQTLEEQLFRARSAIGGEADDTRWLHADGSAIDVSVNTSAIRDSRDNATGFSCIVRDIRERKRQEGELRRLLSEVQRAERRLGALMDVGIALLSDRGLEASLQLVARRACELVDADGAAILLPSSRPGFVVHAAAEGAILAHLSGVDMPESASLAGAALRRGTSWRMDDVRAGPAGRSPSMRDLNVAAALCVPLSTTAGVGGALFLGRVPGRAGFSADEEQLVERFADQAGLALELAKAREDRVQLGLLSDRERIARDLHDHVIQRLFAIGMSLQSVGSGITDDHALERVAVAVDELDTTIREIRSTIFTLDPKGFSQPATPLSGEIARIAEQASDGLGFAPYVTFEGPVDAVPAHLGRHVQAVVREALSNTARHAAATHAEVLVTAGTDLCVVVADNGCGIGEMTRTSGLANLRARAEAQGGRFHVEGSPASGTRVEWRVPCDSAGG